MLKNKNDYLPIGTVVLLKNGEKRLMIFGIIQADMDHPNEEYDYIGVPYPEGNMGQDHQYLFYHNDITQVFYRGFEDIERQSFIQSLTEFYEEESDETR